VFSSAATLGEGDELGAITKPRHAGQEVVDVEPGRSGREVITGAYALSRLLGAVVQDGEPGSIGREPTLVKFTIEPSLAVLWEPILTLEQIGHYTSTGA
jgi:hypothetical protein